MARGRKDVLFTEVDEVSTSVRRAVNSKAQYNMFLCDFLNRRLNTSYSKRLWFNGHGEVRLREVWSAVDFGRLESTIEMVAPQGVIARAKCDGTFEFMNDFVRSLPWYGSIRTHIYRAVEDNLTQLRVLANGTKIMTWKSRLPAEVPTREINEGQQFNDYLNEWRV